MVEAERAVVALGGNAILGGDGDQTADGQRRVVEKTAETVADAVREGYEVVVTHGNGPQVGSLMLQQEAAPETPQMPLDVLVAETQGQVGYMLQQALNNRLNGGFVTVVTQTVVDADDEAFENPTKPVGPVYNADEASDKDFETREVEGGYRRVVPSPEPQEVVETDEIGTLLERGGGVVCAGGGGVPVVCDGGLRGVEAVIDKDRTSRLIANEIDADVLYFLTDVEYAYVDYGGPDQRPLGDTAPEKLREHLDAGEFGEGSMRPKVESALAFVESGGGEAVITSPEAFEASIRDDAGTRVRR